MTNTQESAESAEREQRIADALSSIARTCGLDGAMTLSRRGGVCLRKLTGARHCPASIPKLRGLCCGACMPRHGFDHTSLILHDGAPFAIFTQPYGLSDWQIRGLLDWAQKHGLETTIDSGWSWHSPGRTVGVLFRRPEPSERGNTPGPKTEPV